MRETPDNQEVCKCRFCTFESTHYDKHPCSSCFWIPIGDSSHIGSKFTRGSNHRSKEPQNRISCEIPTQEHVTQLEFEIAELRERLDYLYNYYGFIEEHENET